MKIYKFSTILGGLPFEGTFAEPQKSVDAITGKVIMYGGERVVITKEMITEVESILASEFRFNPLNYLVEDDES